MSFYIHRLPYNIYKNLVSFVRIRNTLTDISIPDSSHIIIIVSQSLMVLGAFRYSAKANEFILEKLINKNVKDFLDKLPMVKFINERTYKLFAKKLRPIDEDDYKAFLG